MVRVCSIRIASSGGKDNSSGGPVPLSRIACQSTRRKNSKGRCHHTKTAPRPVVAECWIRLLVRQSHTRSTGHLCSGGM
jgi:hypothetical protein